MMAIIYGVLLALLHYFSEKIEPSDIIKKNKLLSFIAGISITYIFLFLMPKLYSAVEIFHESLFLFVLGGFAIFHLIEKHIYQHESKEKLHDELRLAHSLLFFVYHFVIGILLFELAEIGGIKSYLFFVLIALYTAVSSTSLKGIHVKIRGRRALKIILSCSTLLGVMAASFFLVPPNVLQALLGFMVGSILYVVVRDSVPRETEGKALYFVLGVLIYSVLIGITWFI